ncbi:MAG: FHA domain-containing protein [Deltaproteobacteria bacterium]|nr:FHA domain-containing protein [Deltaproteobacteria bacterium]
MATLTFLTPDGAENQFELAGELKVGREQGNDVVLPEGGLSRNHCRFYEDGGQIWVEDFNSSNGTFVDGQRIGEPTPLEEGQEILVANIQVQLSAAAARAGTPRRQASGVRKAAGSSARTGQMQAVKRNGPSTALAKRGTSGSSPARRGNTDDGEAGALAQPAARGTLKGMTGPWAGKRFALSKMVSVVGRVEGNEVVVDDDSVSRRHAEVRKSGPGYVVRDLNSANGTYVNNERVTEAPLRPGDVVKFGVVEFTYSGPSLGKNAGGAGGGGDPAKKKKLLIFGGGGAAALLLVGFMAHEALTPPPSANPMDNPANQAQQNAAPDATALLGMCRSFSDTEGNTLDWKRAVEACDNVLKADPINADARKLKKLSEKELGQQKAFEHAHELYSVGQEEAAMDEFEKVESDSYYIAQARNDYKHCAEQVKKRNGDACLKMDKAAEFEKAWIACKAYEDLAVCMGTEDKFQKLFLELQKRYKGKDEWVQNPKYKRWVCTTIGPGGEDPRKDQLKKMYSADPDLADAMVLFAKDPVVGRLAIMRARDKGKDATRANKILQFADELYSKHQGAYEKITSHNRDAAAKDIKQEIEADHAIMPKDQETDMVAQDRDAIANAFADQGKLYFQQQRYDKAFEECFKGYDFTHANLNVSSCLADLETYAATLPIDSCEGATQIEHITRKDSLPHKHASEAKAKNHCP